RSPTRTLLPSRTLFRSVTGWVTLDNQSGAAYRDARLQLLAGDVRRVQDQLQIRGGRVQEMVAYADVAPQLEEEAFFAYHLYTLRSEEHMSELQSRENLV